MFKGHLIDVVILNIFVQVHVLIRYFHNLANVLEESSSNFDRSTQLVISLERSKKLDTISLLFYIDLAECLHESTV